MERERLELEALERDGLLRSLKGYARDGVILRTRNGEELIDFSSNDYLGLSQHPRLIEVAQDAIRKYGVGSTASRLISGTTLAHQEAEETIAQHKEAEVALLFSTGYMTAMGVIPSLAGKEDVIILDKLCHACLIDAARASGARLRVFPHNDLNKLESLLKSEREKLSVGSRILLLTESVYSMDGDLCPLAEIVELKDKYGALLLVDEAHGLGVLGGKGMGLAEELGLQSRIELQMGTLGKAAGGAGGYIAASRSVCDLIINKGRSFIFTTAPPPAQAAVAQEAFNLISSEEGGQLRKRLKEHRATLGGHMNQTTLPSAICPVIIGENEPTLEASQSLRDKGLLVPAIRYPTVAKGTARLRITLYASHSEEQVRSLMSFLSTDFSD